MNEACFFFIYHPVWFGKLVASKVASRIPPRSRLFTIKQDFSDFLYLPIRQVLKFLEIFHVYYFNYAQSVDRFQSSQVKTQYKNNNLKL